MSAELAWSDIATAAPVETEEPRRRLRLLDRPGRRRRPRLLYPIIVMATVIAVGGAQMLLTIATTQDSFELAELRSQQRELSLQVQAAKSELQGLNSPQYLASNADALGMVVGGIPAYLRLSDAEVLGTAESAKWLSSIDPNSSVSVSNAIVAETPLITDPASTITGTIQKETTDPTTLPVTEPALNLPPAITEGLPSPKTH